MLLCSQDGAAGRWAQKRAGVLSLLYSLSGDMIRLRAHKHTLTWGLRYQQPSKCQVTQLTMQN